MITFSDSIHALFIKESIIPATCMLIAARELGATRAELVKHATSGDVTGDFSGVVGYAGLVVF